MVEVLTAGSLLFFLMSAMRHTRPVLYFYLYIFKAVLCNGFAFECSMFSVQIQGSKSNGNCIHQNLHQS